MWGGANTKDGHEEEQTTIYKVVDPYQMTKLHFQTILSLKKLDIIVININNYDDMMKFWGGAIGIWLKGQNT